MVVHTLFGLRRGIGIHIANGDNADALDVEEVDHVADTLAAAADHAHEDFIVGRACLGAEECHGGEAKGGDAGR